MMVQALLFVLVVWSREFPHETPLLVEVSPAFGQDEGRDLLVRPQLWKQAKMF